jgi:hypothetical protein
VGRAAELVTAVLREVFRHEELPPPPPVPAPPPAEAPQRRAYRLLAPEPLPPDLPPLARATAGGRSPLGLLLGPDPLPEDPALAHRPGGRWLAWLFGPERLEP